MKPEEKYEPQDFDSARELIQNLPTGSRIVFDLDSRLVFYRDQSGKDTQTRFTEDHIEIAQRVFWSWGEDHIELLQGKIDKFQIFVVNKKTARRRPGTEHQIKDRRSGKVIFSGETNNLRDLVLTAHRMDVDLSWAHLAGIDLSNVDLSGLYANLTGVDLTGADLTNADLTDAVLSHAILRNAKLIAADFTGADLSYADLDDSDLSQADLGNANLNHAHCHGACVTDIAYDEPSSVFGMDGFLEAYEKTE